MTQLRLVDIERLIRDLISDSGFTATLLTVQADPRRQGCFVVAEPEPFRHGLEY